jgi:hypothetical protein
MRDYEYWELDELGSYLSDFHKEIFGFRIRGIDWSSRAVLIAEIRSLDDYMDQKRSTFWGREELRADGWHVVETDPELIQRAAWLAEERAKKLWDEEHDGQPNEAQEWHDYDPDC